LVIAEADEAYVIGKRGQYTPVGAYLAGDEIIKIALATWSANDPSWYEIHMLLPVASLISVQVMVSFLRMLDLLGMLRRPDLLFVFPLALISDNKTRS
jgi:hypothetical protein